MKWQDEYPLKRRIKVGWWAALWRLVFFWQDHLRDIDVGGE